MNEHELAVMDILSSERTGQTKITNDELLLCTYSGAQKFGNTQNFFEKLPPSGTETSKSNILWHTSSLVLDELACQFLSKYFTPLLSYANFPKKRVSKSLETP